MTSLWTQLASAFGWVIYASFFEWYWHKLWMHTPRPPKEAFRGHTIVHHGLYKGDQSYFVAEGEHPEHILLKPYALPVIFAAHLPVVFLIEHFAPHTAIGACVAMVLYFVVYEYMHWNMHVPRGHFVERFRWFQFLRQHHKLHHRYYQKNFCVLFPLADLCLGTLITEQSLARQKAAREQAIADGNIAQVRRKPRHSAPKPGRNREARAARPRLSDLIRTPALEYKADRKQRQRDRRRERRVEEVRAMLETVKDRRDR